MRAPHLRERSWLLKLPVRLVKPPRTPLCPQRLSAAHPSTGLAKCGARAAVLWSPGQWAGELGSGTSGARPRRAASLSQSASGSRGHCPGSAWIARWRLADSTPPSQTACNSGRSRAVLDGKRPWVRENLAEADGPRVTDLASPPLPSSSRSVLGNPKWETERDFPREPAAQEGDLARAPTGNLTAPECPLPSRHARGPTSTRTVPPFGGVLT